jgi:threonine dehydrogenase-like Zn-dependent dehydrogenase
MKAVTWHGQRDVRVEEVPDPFVQEPTDAVIRVTTSNICGSDLHLYEPLAPFMGVGNILGHENMGQVVEVGAECGDLEVGGLLEAVLPAGLAPEAWGGAEAAAGGGAGGGG